MKDILRRWLGINAIESELDHAHVRINNLLDYIAKMDIRYNEQIRETGEVLEEVRAALSHRLIGEVLPVNFSDPEGVEALRGDIEEYRAVAASIRSSPAIGRQEIARKNAALSSIEVQIDRLVQDHKQAQ